MIVKLIALRTAPPTEASTCRNGSGTARRCGDPGHHPPTKVFVDALPNFPPFHFGGGQLGACLTELRRDAVLPEGRSSTHQKARATVSQRGTWGARWSLRLAEGRERLAERARRVRIAGPVLAQRYLEEGLRHDVHHLDQDR
jgi:hypothetical protein